MQEKGTISIHTENILPIIKKSLYSDHEIFLRELISNAQDATQKLLQLTSLGEYSGDLGETKITISLDAEAKTLTISDRGIGMTAEEIKKYINQIAFSGATEFLEKYKDKGAENQIIGHFGLGFYSAFMVANKVEIDTLSYKEGSTAAHWVSENDNEFEISDGSRTERGTDIILHIEEESVEFLETARIQGILDKYAKFLPIEVEFEEKVVNNTEPLWAKSPSDLSDQDYLDFYKELYPFSEDPLFWIHLNVDYPFNLTGILYFPKVKNDLELQRNKIQLYSRQVFITDEVKDIVPEFLMLLHGVIDSPDIPLNVSRSYLQSDSNVKKISNYITKKVADKLNELFKDQREDYESKWDDIGVFVKYGMITEEKFAEKAMDFVLMKSVDGKCHTLEEYQELIATNQTDKDENKVILYTNDPGKQDSYITAATKRGYDVAVLEGPIDSHFINHLEQKLEKVQLKRVDADIVDKLIDKGEEQESVLSDDEKKKVEDVFKTAIGDETLNLQVESLAPDEMPVTITQPEFMRRMAEMAASGGGMGMMGGMPNQHQVVVNGNHPLVTKIVKAQKAEKKEMLAKQAYDLARLSQNMLDGKSLTDFIERSVELASNQ
ncbi:MAG: molecular chaperone HtpG [Bacteroidota bacterium]